MYPGGEDHSGPWLPLPDGYTAPSVCCRHHKPVGRELPATVVRMHRLWKKRQSYGMFDIKPVSEYVCESTNEIKTSHLGRFFL